MNIMIVSPVAGQTGCSTASIFLAISLAIYNSSVAAMRMANSNIDNFYEPIGIQVNSDLEHHQFKNWENMLTGLKQSSDKPAEIRAFTFAPIEGLCCDIIPQPPAGIDEHSVVPNIKILINRANMAYQNTLFDIGTDIDSPYALELIKYIDKILIVTTQDYRIINKAKQLRETILTKIPKKLRTVLESTPVGKQDLFYYVVNKFDTSISSIKSVASKLEIPQKNLISITANYNFTKRSNEGRLAQYINTISKDAMITKTLNIDMQRICKILVKDR